MGNNLIKLKAVLMKNKKLFIETGLHLICGSTSHLGLMKLHFTKLDATLSKEVDGVT